MFFLKVKFKIILSVLILLWGIAFVQTLVTRIYISRSAFTQAFARNRIAVIGSEAQEDMRNKKVGNVCREGIITGRLSKEKRQEITKSIFREFGGTEVMNSDPENENYYVAYGYTNGVDVVKYVNGKKINLNIALSYDEQDKVTRVIVGIPFVNSDF